MGALGNTTNMWNERSSWFLVGAATALGALGMRPTVVGDRVGQASTIKMMRSVMIKGIEALTAECLLGARLAGVDERVLASLQASVGLISMSSEEP